MKSRSDGANLIALYHFISGFLSLLAICLILTVPLMTAMFVPVSGDWGMEPVMTMAIFGLLGAGIFLFIAIANFVVGWGLWNLREWARISAIALAFFRLVNIPLGTIIGGLIIWHLLKDETKAQFAVG